jgi:hypothetical protein
MCRTENAIEPLLMGNAAAVDVLTGANVTLNLQDPDSMTLDPLGNIVLDSQADQELIYVTHPGEPNQRRLDRGAVYEHSRQARAA